MRHDTSPTDMAHGFYGVLWENACYWQGVVHICTQRRQTVERNEERFWKAVYDFALLGRRMNRTHFERVQDGVNRLGMGDLPPHIKSEAIPAHLSGWSAFQNVGACETCLEKPPLERRNLLTDDARIFAGNFMNALWHSMVASIEYGRFYVRTIEDNNFFNDDDGAYFIEQHFSGGLGTLGRALECYPTTVQAYDYYLGPNEKNTEEWRDVLNVRVRGVGQICDMALERDWCQTCQADLRDVPVSPIPDPR